MDVPRPLLYPAKACSHCELSSEVLGELPSEVLSELSNDKCRSNASVIALKL